MVDGKSECLVILCEIMICYNTTLICFGNIKESTLIFQVTSANWLLSALGWRHKNFRGFVSVCHTFGWGAPAALTLAAVVAHKIDADELTGLCGVGFQDSQSLLHFVLLPESALYIVSLALVIAA